MGRAQNKESMPLNHDNLPNNTKKHVNYPHEGVHLSSPSKLYACGQSTSACIVACIQASCIAQSSTDKCVTLSDDACAVEAQKRAPP